MILARLLMAYVVKQSPDSRVAKKTETEREAMIERWAKPIDMLNRLDKQSWGTINGTIHWVFGDPFWSGVIQGGDNLRDKWDKIQAQRVRGRKQAPKSPSQLALEEFDRLRDREDGAA